MSLILNGTSGISGVDGTAATPALQGNDSNTGISFGTDTVTINTGGVARVTIADDGATVISVNSTTNALRITQTGTGNVLLVEDSANPDASPFVITGNGDLLQGSITSNSSLGYTQGSQFYRQSGTVGQFRYSADTGSPESVSSKARGNQASPTVVNSGDALWLGRYAGYDGANFVESARISVQVDGTPGTNDMPGRLTFSTTADGASSPTERMRIDSAGVTSLRGTSAADGSDPVTFQLRDAASYGGWTAGANFAQIQFYSSDASAAGVRAQIHATQANAAGTASDLVFGTANAGASTPTERMRIDSAGNVGIGVTPSVWQSNWKAIEAYSGALASLSTGISLRIYSNGHINGSGVENYPRTGASSKIDLSGGGFAFFTAPSGTAGNAISFTSRLELQESGLAGSFVTNNDGFQVCSSAAAGNTWANFVGRHSATSPLTGTISFVVRNNGNVLNTNNSYGAISDLKLKENIVDATPKLGKLNQVRVVNYNIIGDTQKQLGVISQELEKIFPGMVDETPDRDDEGNDLGTTTKSVKYSVFVPMLIKAIQEQQTIIQSLTARLEALENK